MKASDKNDSGLEMCHSKTPSFTVCLLESDLAGLIVFQPTESITVVLLIFTFSVLLVYTDQVGRDVGTLSHDVVE